MQEEKVGYWKNLLENSSNYFLKQLIKINKIPEKTGVRFVSKQVSDARTLAARELIRERIINRKIGLSNEKTNKSAPN